MSDTAMTSKRIKSISVLSFICCLIVFSMVVAYIAKCEKDKETIIHTTVETLTGRIVEVSTDSNNNFPRVEYILDKTNLVYVFYNWDVYNECKGNEDKSIVVEMTTLTYKSGDEHQYVSGFVRVE